MFGLVSERLKILKEKESMLYTNSLSLYATRSYPRLSHFFFRGPMISHCDRIHFSLTIENCFNDGYMRKQPAAWKE